MSWQYYGGENKFVIRTNPNGSIDSRAVDAPEVAEWIAAGNAPLPDPEMTLAKVKTRSLDVIRSSGVAILDAAGYQAHKQTQMTVFVMGEIIKALKDIIAKSGITLDTSELDTVLAAIPYLTDLTFPQVVAMAGEIGKIRGAVNALEAQMEALPATATIADVEALAKTEIPKPKNRREIEAGK